MRVAVTKDHITTAAEQADGYIPYVGMEFGDDADRRRRAALELVGQALDVLAPKGDPAFYELEGEALTLTEAYTELRSHLPVALFTDTWGLYDDDGILYLQGVAEYAPDDDMMLDGVPWEEAVFYWGAGALGTAMLKVNGEVVIA